MYLIYRLFTAASMLVLAPYFALRGWRRGEPARMWRQRMGDLPPEISAPGRTGAPAATIARTGERNGPVWLHAVSVGEVLAAVPLVEGIRKEFPDRSVFVSTTTETGRRLASERLSGATAIFYFPMDWIVPVRRALGAIRPSLMIIMETEIWPNFLREARRQGVPVIFANARISERSFKQFKRWKFLVDQLFEKALQSARLFLAQSVPDAERLAEMGAPEDRVEVTGNLKYDVEPPSIGAFGAWLRAQVSQQERWPVVVAGSVVAEEEHAVLEAYAIVQRQWRRALLVLAPRKPDRFDAAAEIVAAGGWDAVRRSTVDMSAPLDENAEVIILDSIGELAGIYSLGDAVFVGGSLVPSGGHNILEPAWFSQPPVFGTSMENFREMASAFLSARAGIQVTSGTQLGKVWTQLIGDPKVREQMGIAARELSERNRGSAARSLERIVAVMKGARDGVNG
jgi:3-deoxy-D-manno-octulosonic-acid transferase